ncbi:hypothetical protein G6514_001126 [Epicoccum nigrum]|nr:hypothetical protein G6514_001126 [Epicoccum nigrum]
MEASTRLYARLGEIPEDPNDPDSLDDLIVCAFGAFERYYLCWKTKGGKYKQDGYGLPPALNEWLNPTDGTTRDWGSLQVVFGRGEEYFASDSNGKLEYKEPEVRKLAEEEQKEKVDRQSMRRSRTVSFLRPLSQTSIRSDGAAPDTLSMHRRASSSISSHRASRPPSLSYSTTGSEASLEQTGDYQTQRSTQAAYAPLFSRGKPMNYSTAVPQDSTEPQAIESTEVKNASVPQRFSRSQANPSAQNTGPSLIQALSPDREANQPTFTTIPEEQTERNPPTANNTPPCTCGCHSRPLATTHRPIYTNASVQTDPEPPRTKMPLRIDTFTASNWGDSAPRSVSYEVYTPGFDDGACAVPFSMGRMTNYFSKPGYQLGDSLSNGYRYFEQPVYQYQDEFGEEALR